MIKLLDILELNTQKKPYLGRGGEANVYDFALQPDKLVNSKIGLKIDFSFENVGYDKQGNLKMFDF